MPHNDKSILDLNPISGAGGFVSGDLLYAARPGGTPLDFKGDIDDVVTFVIGQAPLRKIDATTGPTVNDDSANTSGDGVFSIDSIWIDVTNDEAYRCMDATPTAAVWINTTLEIGELGTMAVQDSNNVTITGGTISGITSLSISGNLSITGTVDGRDLASDGTKLDGIEADATADQTGAEIKTAYEAEANAYTDSKDIKLSGIETLADVTDTVNVTAAGALMDSEVDVDIKTLSLPASTTISIFGASLVDDADASAGRTTLGLVIGTNVQAFSSVLQATTASFLTGDETKLDGIEAGATADQTGAEIKTAYEAEANTNEFSDFEQTKLADINDRGFHIQTGFFDGNSFSTAGQDTGPAGFAYNNDGTRMWVAGGITDTIYEYDLATPYRPSTAVYNGVFLSIAAQEGSVSGITIKPDGTKFFICGSNDDEVNQYSFGSPFALTGASFDSVTVSVSAQSTIPRGLQFNDDGSKLFIAEIVGTIFQYTVTSGDWDLSGGIVFDNVSLDTSTEDTAANGLVFKEGGRKLYIPGGENDKVYQYDLPTPYTLTGAKYDNISFDVSSEDTDPVEVLFDPNGSGMAVVGNATDAIYEYELDSDGIFTDVEKIKLSGIETLADVTDTVNVTAAGALMDSEVDVDIKTLSLPASTTISIFGASLVDDADASAGRTTLELIIGADVQAFDVDTAKLDVVQEFIKQQGFNETVLIPLGTDLVTNGDFAADTDWTKGTGWTISSGVASSNGSQSADADLTQLLSLVSGKTYEVEFTISNYSAGNATPVAGDTEGTDRAANGTFTENIVAGAGGDIDIRADLDFVGDIDDVTVKLANVSWDLNDNQVTKLTLDGDLVLDNPTNQQAGTTYIATLTQDGVGSRTLSYGSVFKFPGGTAPTLSTGVNDVDIISFVSDGTNMYGVFQGDFS